MHEHFMFPSMGMLRRVSAGSNLKNPHIKISSTVLLADDHPSRDPFGQVIIKVSGFDFGILLNLHKSSRDACMAP